jgi:hypothetical protein
MFEQIPRLDGESGASACSAKAGGDFDFANIPGISYKIHHLISVTGSQVKYSGYLDMTCSLSLTGRIKLTAA